ncbi:MAG TPA: hypothetical protein QGF58_14200 [Myxococcota bacterium]|nr:hypothetical protein [Myxococcota bacterium]
MNLSVQAGSPIPVLVWLVQETDFHGLLLIGIGPRQTFGNGDSHERASGLYLRRYEQWKSSPAKRSEAILDELLGRRFASRGPSVDLDMLIHTAMVGRPLTPPFVAMRHGRWLELDDEVPGAFVEAQLSATKRTTPATPAGKKQRVEAFVALTRILEERGATVVFVHHPTSGGVEDYETEHWPREEFFDRLPLKTGLPALHHEDDPRTAELVPVDGSHLGRSDAPIYTEALLSRLDALQSR